jgi:hypothetical protein
MQTFGMSQKQVSRFELSLIIISVTLITGSSLDELMPTFSKILRLVAYASILFFCGWHLFPVLQNPQKYWKIFIQRYRYFLIAIVLYFLGLLIGGLRGPNPAGSLWQTFSDGLVFLYAFVVFGVTEMDPNRLANEILRVVALWTGLLLLGSLIIYIGNIADWWMINPYYHSDEARSSLLLNGPFGHANHFAYVLMIGAFASGYAALLKEDQIQWKWAALTAFLCLGILLTFGRGSMLGTAFGLLIMLLVRDRKLGLLAIAASVVFIAYLLAGALELISVPDFVPKISFASRGLLWETAMENLRSYGPLGVGSGQAQSIYGMGIHNFFLEQYGEGGLITVIGILLWLAIPLTTLKQSVLDKKFKVAILALMTGIMVHGLFWNQFLNGLRFLTFAGVLLWTALATTKSTYHE